MSDLGAQLSQLTPEQRQAIMMKAQQEANEQVMQEMMKRMTSACFERCAGTSVRQSFLSL
jgi:Tim10/DDP family zinc finger